MKPLLYFFVFSFSISSFSKEWKSLQQYTKKTKQVTLSNKDWLLSDRKQNTITWQKANVFNLQNNFPEEYQSIKQRRDFYQWFYLAIETQGHQVVWPQMAHYISSKLQLVKSFPYLIFTKKSIKKYASKGNKTVFNMAFSRMNQLYFSTTILKDELAFQWDKNMLYNEQYKWLDNIYKTIDATTLKTISRMTKGKGFYAIMVPKKIRFQGDVSNAETRYNYAIHTLREFCKKHYR